MFAKLRFERALREVARSEHEALADYANADWPALDEMAGSARFLAVDFELDGLRKDAHLLQVGWVSMVAGSIRLAAAVSLDIQSDARLDDTAVTIHGIGEQRAALGRPIGEVTAKLLHVLAGRVLVAHAAGIEVDAIRRACQVVYGQSVPVRAVCTLALERKLHPNLVGSEAYRLGPCRERYGLPPYRAHDALTDAIAAAELFLAQLSRLPADTRLKQLEMG